MPTPTAFRAPLAYENKPFLHSPDGRVLRILSEYAEPLARFRREKIQDTVVFFGSARFHSRSDAQNALEVLEKPGSAALAPPEQQPTVPSGSGRCRELQVKRARAAVDMARYYAYSRLLAFLLTQSTSILPFKL